MMAEAIDLHRRGRFVEAERIYRRILQTEPNHPDALHLLGLIAREAGQTEAAIQLIQRAIGISPDTASFRSNLAMIYEQAGRYDDCEAAARGALALNPDDGNALHCLANALRATDRHEEAAGIYAAAVEIVTDDPTLWSNYGATLQTLGRADEAVPMLERAVTLSPGQAELHSNLGNARLAAGQAEAAVQSYRDALRLDPSFAPAYTNLANALMQAGESTEAGKVLHRCLEVRPGNCKALAYLAAAASEAGDPGTRDRLMDFDRLMTSRRCSAPEGYESLEAFNRALVEHVTRHGTRKWEPVTKTTRLGSQTGELLDENPGPVSALEQMVRDAVADYLAAVPDGADHPFLASAPEEWRLTMWATILEKGGHQAAHLHPTGWLSGVYYAAVPEAPPTDGEQAGWIEFGRPPDNFRTTRPAATRLIEPEAGLMLLFPSYFYHRTIPFAGDGLRVSIAFDIMPTRKGEQETGTERRLSREETAAEGRRIQDLLRAGDVAEARTRAETLVQASQKDPAAVYLAGVASYRSGDVKKAEQYFSWACEKDPGNARYRLDHAACLQQLDRPEAAAENLEMAAELDPEDVEAFMRLGTLHSDRGDFDGARRAYERAIARQPSHGGAHYGLASLKSFSRDDPQIDQLQDLLHRTSLEPSNEAVICFALARAMDQLDKLEEAMDLYARGNRIKRELTDFDMEAERSNVGRIIRAFGPDVFEQFAGCGDPSELPVFVIGMPRSGTTLVEQILDSHPGICGAGELNDLWRVVNGVGRHLPTGVNLPEGVRQVPPDAWKERGSVFLKRIRRYDREAERIVDKLPFNYTLAGIIRLMLPGARIVHCVRDPRDTCVSSYMTSFQNDRGFTCNLGELGETYRLYWQLMEHWQKVLPGGLYEVRYESLVDDLEGEARRMIDYMGLDWSDDCLRFFENPRKVTTASMTQVRQPVYRSSVGRWRRYAPYLSPLLEALGDMRRYGIDED
jgi:tetratricopeptide (TPR) repeat protein